MLSKSWACYLPLFVSMGSMAGMIRVHLSSASCSLWGSKMRVGRSRPSIFFVLWPHVPIVTNRSFPLVFI